MPQEVTISLGWADLQQTILRARSLVGALRSPRVIPIVGSEFSREETRMRSSEERVLVVRPGERRDGPPTPGIEREQAFATEAMWAGLVRTGPGMASGWHHHGEYETVIYVLTGTLRMEFGPGGSTAVDAGPGDFARVSKGVVHRESNPGTDPSTATVVRAGSGESIINVEGPDGGGDPATGA